MIDNIKRNRMGTVSFYGKFMGMRKAQDFITYPIPSGGEGATAVKIQSDTRIGYINLVTGEVKLSPPRAGGAYNVHLVFAVHVGKLSEEELFMYKAHLLDSAHKHAGTNGVVYTENGGAAGVFGVSA